MRYLPVPSFWWYPEPFAEGPRMIVVPADTPVHVTRSGRVTHLDDQAVGTVVVRDDHECFHHYRRLRASSISVEVGALVDAGDVIGVVAHPNDGSTPALLYGVHDAADTWIDIVELLAGARDPVVLDQRLPVVESTPQPVSSAAPTSSADRTPSTRPHSTPTVPTGRATASSLAGRPPAAVQDVQPHDDESIELPDETPTTASEPSPTTAPDQPPASPPAASDEPPAPAPVHEPDTSRRSRLAARRPPRRPS